MNQVLFIKLYTFAFKDKGETQREHWKDNHYSDVIISGIASQITGVSIVYQNVCSGADQRRHQSSASLAFVRGIHRTVTRKMFPFDDVIIAIMISPVLKYIVKQG